MHPSEYSARRPALWLLAGRLALLRGDPSRATAEFERYVETNPLQTFGWAQLAIAYEQTGQPRERRASAAQLRARVLQGGIQALDRGDSSQAAQLFARWPWNSPQDYEPAKRALIRVANQPGYEQRKPWSLKQCLSVSPLRRRLVVQAISPPRSLPREIEVSDNGPFRISGIPYWLGGAESFGFCARRFYLVVAARQVAQPLQQLALLR